MAEAIAQPLRNSAAGDSSAERFEDLYRRTSRRVYAYVASILRDRSAAEEVTAQTFERAFRKRASFRPRRGSTEAWLFGIARNAALDELRRRRRRAAREVDVEDPWLAGPEVEIEDEERRAAVRAALATLDPRERDLLALKFAAGLQNVEIARVLGVSATSAGTRLHRAIEKLREACSEAL